MDIPNSFPYPRKSYSDRIGSDAGIIHTAFIPSWTVSIEWVDNIEALLAPWSRKYTTISLPRKVFKPKTHQALVQIMSQIISTCIKFLGTIREAILCKTRCGNNYAYYCIRSRLHAHRIRIALLLMGSLGWSKFCPDNALWHSMNEQISCVLKARDSGRSLGREK